MDFTLVVCRLPLVVQKQTDQRWDKFSPKVCTSRKSVNTDTDYKALKVREGESKEPVPLDSMTACTWLGAVCKICHRWIATSTQWDRKCSWLEWDRKSSWLEWDLTLCCRPASCPLPASLWVCLVARPTLTTLYSSNAKPETLPQGWRRKWVRVGG